MHSRDVRPVRIAGSLLLSLLLGGVLSTATYAQTNTWTGLGADNNWSMIGNWNSNGVPVSAAATSLDFTGGALTSNNNLGAFQLNRLQFDVSADITLSGNDLNFVSNGVIKPAVTQNSSFAVTIDNDLTLTNNLIVNLAGSGNLNLNGVISGAGSLTLAGSNAAHMAVLANSGNSYSGGTIVAGGALQLGMDNALPSGNDLTLTGVTSGAMVDLNGHAATVGNITFADGTPNSVNNIAISDSSTGAMGLLTLNGNITYNPAGNLVTPTAYINSNLALSAGQHVIDNNGKGAFSAENYDVIIGGVISGNGGLDIGTVNDSGTGLYAVLTHANSYTGPTNILNGGLFLGTTNALAVGSSVTLGARGSLYLYIANDYTETGLTAGSYNQTIGSLADNINSSGGKVYLGSSTLTVGVNNANTTFSGQIEDNDGQTADATTVMGNLVKTGTGTLTLSGSNTYTGSTTIYAGILQLGISDALPDVVNGLLVSTNLTLNGGVFDMNANNQTVNNLTNQGGSVLVHGGGAVLTVSGAYTQSTGTTQVDDTLNLTPGGAQPGDLKITGGQLVGVGSIGNATPGGTVTVTNSGGTVQPGDILSTTGTKLLSPTIGTLAINGNYTQMSGGALQIDLASGTKFDQLMVSGNASLAGTLNVKLLNGFVPTNGEQFDFMTYGALSGSFDSIVALDPGYTDTVTFVNSVGVLTIAGVPECTTLLSAALMLSTGSLLLRLRRGKEDAQRP